MYRTSSRVEWPEWHGGNDGGGMDYTKFRAWLPRESLDIMAKTLSKDAKSYFEYFHHHTPSYSTLVVPPYPLSIFAPPLSSTIPSQVPPSSACLAPYHVHPKTRD